MHELPPNPPAGAFRAGTIADACRITTFSKTKIYELINEGKIEAYSPMPRKTIVNLDSCYALMNAMPKFKSWKAPGAQSAGGKQ